DVNLTLQNYFADKNIYMQIEFILVIINNNFLITFYLQNHNLLNILPGHSLYSNLMMPIMLRNTQVSNNKKLNKLSYIIKLLLRKMHTRPDIDMTDALRKPGITQHHDYRPVERLRNSLRCFCILDGCNAALKSPIVICCCILNAILTNDSTLHQMPHFLFLF
ncbi:hypothetical protein L9F63_004864, partial [Diploptera punctata]